MKDSEKCNFCPKRALWECKICPTLRIQLCNKCRMSYEEKNRGPKFISLK